MQQEVNKLMEVAERIHEMREICGLSIETMAEKTEVTVKQYVEYENGQADFPFTFIHKCSLAFNIGITDLLEGQSAHLATYTVTRKGEGHTTAKEDGISIKNLAPMFRQKISEPYSVRYEYSKEKQDAPIHLTKHSGQEFDFILSGRLKVQVGDNIEYLSEGDSIYYNSSTPHGMIAVDGQDCQFIAIILPGENETETVIRSNLMAKKVDEKFISDEFVTVEENENRAPMSISFQKEDKFNFGFDIVDEIADKKPNRLAMVHIDKKMVERKFTFKDVKKESNRIANYLKSIGIEKGDRVMLVLKRHYEFWFTIIALHKLGAIAIPATNQLQQHDYEYRFNSAGVKAVIATSDGSVTSRIDEACQKCETLQYKIVVGEDREGWRNLKDEATMFSTRFARKENTACGDDTMLMFFTSGTTGYPKIATHSYKYALGHYLTAKYWHGVESDGLHFTISETGWGKALWGKLYGQWLCEGAVFTYDFDKFDASKILPMFKKYNITSFCAPPTMLRMMIKEDLSQYDLSSIKHMTTAGEALNPEVYKQFEKLTGLQIMEGFGQTETTLTIANFVGSPHKIGSMGRPSPLYDIVLLSTETGEEVKDGETGEICVSLKNGKPCGLFKEYYMDTDKTTNVMHDGYYHTGDVAWRDEEGFFWYVGRADDVIKSSGYRIGPFEIESVIMELPYVLECGVSPVPDEIRGQVVKASIVLTKDRSPSEQLILEIQNYVKEKTAPYKYPRIVEFKKELPKTISGKIQRSKLI